MVVDREGEGLMRIVFLSKVTSPSTGLAAECTFLKLIFFF